MYNDKEEQIGRLDLLYDPMVLEQALDKYGSESRIKANVKTSAMTYEIRTAMHYWFDAEDTVRTNSALWKQLRVHDEDGLPPEEADRL